MDILDLNKGCIQFNPWTTSMTSLTYHLSSSESWMCDEMLSANLLIVVYNFIQVKFGVKSWVLIVDELPCKADVNGDTAIMNIPKSSDTATTNSWVKIQCLNKYLTC